MATDLAVTETGAKRFIERWAPFFYFCKHGSIYTALCRYGIGEIGQGAGTPCYLCGRPCGDLWPRLEKVDKQTARQGRAEKEIGTHRCRFP